MFLEPVIRYLSASMWKRKHGRLLAVFNFHQVSPAFDPRYHGQYTLTKLDHFQRQIDFIRSYFRVITLPEAIDRFNRDALGGIFAAITFDDGDISMKEYVLPLLKRLAVPATFFINTGYGKGRYCWFHVLNYLLHANDPQVRALLSPGLAERAARLRRTDDPVFYDRTRRELEALAHHVDDRQPLFVDHDWLASLDGEQFTIGAHGHEHQRSSMMSAEWQAENLRRNAEILRQFRAYRPIFALPFGRYHDYDQRSIRVALEQDHTLCTAEGGLNLHRDAYIRRMPADGRDVKALFASEIVGW